MAQAFTDDTRTMRALESRKTSVEAALASEARSRGDCNLHGADAAERIRSKAQSEATMPQ